MKKLFFSLVVLVSLVFLWYQAVNFSKDKLGNLGTNSQPQKQEILRIALVSDSENDNDYLNKALTSAKSNNVNFVIGLGDWTPLGIESDLQAAKKVFDQSGLDYYVTAGDRDLWDSRDKEKEPLSNFNSVFGKSTHVINKGEIQFIVIDNSDIYRGISDVDWEILNEILKSDSKIKFVFSHKTPYHPQSAHIMGSERETVAAQAKEYLDLLEKSKVSGFFSGDLHFFAKFNSPSGMKITTVGAVNVERNFQGPRYAILKIYADHSWDVDDVEI